MLGYIILAARENKVPKQGQQKGTPARRAEFIEHLRTLGPGHFCVNWPWSQAAGRYVRVHIAGEKVSAHRWVYEQINGPLPKEHTPGAIGPVVMHTCDNRACVRPSHLRIGTQEDNIRDAAAKGRMRYQASPDMRQKLSDEDVAAIRRLAKEPDVRQSTLARAYGVSDATISLIVRGKKRVVQPEIAPTVRYRWQDGKLVEGG